MNRRELLRGLALGGAVIAGELWIPGKKLISIPKIHEGNFTHSGDDGCVPIYGVDWARSPEYSFVRATYSPKTGKIYIEHIDDTIWESVSGRSWTPSQTLFPPNRS